jgi:hypothetical protein
MTKSREELAKLNKEQLIDYICRPDYETHQVPSALRGLTFGCMQFVEKVVQYLANMKAKDGLVWKAASHLVDVEFKMDGAVHLVMLAGCHSVQHPNHKDHVEADPCEGCPGPDDVVCNAGLKCQG